MKSSEFDLQLDARHNNDRGRDPQDRHLTVVEVKEVPVEDVVIDPLDRVREIAGWDLLTLTIGTAFGLVMFIIGFPSWMHLDHGDLSWWQILVDAATHLAGFLFFLHQADKALGCAMARVALRRIEGRR